MLRRIILLVSILIALVVLAAVAALVLIDPDDYREEIAARASAELGREVRLDGPIDLKVFPWLAFEIRSASVGNPPEFDEAPMLADVGQATASIRLWPLLRGELEIGAISLEGASFNLVSDARGRSNLDGLFASDRRSDQPADISQLQTGEVRFEDVLLRLIDAGSGERTEIRIESMTLAPFRPDREVPLGLHASVLDGSGNVLAAVEFDGRVNLAADLGRVTLSGWSMEFELPAAEARGRASGSAVLDLAAVESVMRLSDLEAEMDVAGLALGLSGEQDLTVTLGDPVVATLPRAILRVNDQSLAIAGDAILGERIRANLEVNGERLDLAELVSAGVGTDVPVERAGPDDADYSPLQMIDGRFALDLDELVLAEGVRLSAVTARSRLTDGRLVLDPMRAGLFGGRFDGRASVDFNRQPPAVTLSPQLSGVMVEQIAALFTGTTPVTGEGALSLDFSFQGFSPEDMLSTLDGEGSFAVADGVVRGIDLRRLIEEELTVSNLGNVSKAFGGETPFRNLTGIMRAEEGVINLPDLNLAAAGYGARGHGKIDFAADRVDYRIELDLGEELAERLPERLRRATGGRIPLSIAGPVAEPVVSVDLAGIAEGVVRDEIGRQLLKRLGPGANDESDAAAGEEPPDAAADENAEDEEPARQLLRGLLDRAAREDRPAEDESEASEEAQSEQDEPPPTPL